MFSFFSPQAIHFGRGQSAQTPALAKAFGTNILLVHGATARRANWLIDGCKQAGLTVQTLACKNEPSLPDIEQALTDLKGFDPDVVIALGGGAVIDFGKALAALIPCSAPPQDYLEVVGKGRPLDHAPLPLIALPTTAGTGAEVTKNAVITVPEHGIKVSLRDPRMIPDIAIVDAGLMQGAPRRVALAAGLDAITQVIEPYLSNKANPMTDALCLSAIPTGLAAIRELVENDAPAAWDDMARVSTWGGLALANSGLGAVHGFAGVIGGRTNAPHGEICGALLPAVLASHLRKAEAGTKIHSRLAWVLEQIENQFGDGTEGTGLAQLKAWSRKMGLRGLAEMGVTKTDLDAIARASSGASSMKGNPFALTHPELVEILTDAH
ncbi:MAG: iron-containing alcohol dehydrogenase [Sulfitobacter sp.]|nr:iron-containing alcohol dehydrogenase [Sulfitobacter sp.]